jgi:hypothetical protein
MFDIALDDPPAIVSFLKVSAKLNIQHHRLKVAWKGCVDRLLLGVKISCLNDFHLGENKHRAMKLFPFLDTTRRFVCD